MRERGAHKTRKISTPPMSKTNEPKIDIPMTIPINAPGGPPGPKEQEEGEE